MQAWQYMPGGNEQHKMCAIHRGPLIKQTAGDAFCASIEAKVPKYHHGFKQ
jgi:hypothetical protein